MIRRSILFVVLSLGIFSNAWAVEFFCSSVPCIIAAIDNSNFNGQDNTIHLAPGTYTLTSVHNTIDGANGLPSIKGRITIIQPDQMAVIERDPSALSFRLIHVDTGAVVHLYGMALRYGLSTFGGGAVLNRGTLTVEKVAIYGNMAAVAVGGGIGAIGGDTALIDTTVNGNIATTDQFQYGLGGGIFNAPYSELGGVMTIDGVDVGGNQSGRIGGGIYSLGTMAITDTTIHDNTVEAGGLTGGAYIQGDNTGRTSFAISSSTVARNQTGGLMVVAVPSIINNVTAANNTGPGVYDFTVARGRSNVSNSIIGACGSVADFNGDFHSLGNNVLTAPCAGGGATYQSSDIFADPELGTWNLAGKFYELQPSSPAINAGNPVTCMIADELGRPRVGRCDIGAVEYQGRHKLVKAAKLAKTKAH